MLAALEATDGGLARRVLSGDGIVYLGKISYGTYLWHWPVILVLTRTFDPGPLPTIALTVLIATALASLSFQILEHPIRVSALLDRHRRTVIAIGLATSIIAAVIVIPAITNPTTSTTAVAGQDLTTTGFTPVPTGLDWQAIKTDYPTLTELLRQARHRLHPRARHRPPHPPHRRQPRRHAHPRLHRPRQHRTPHPLRRPSQGGCPWQREPVHRAARRSSVTG